MKTLSKIAGLFMLAASLTVSIVACNKTSSQNDGKMTVKMTDAPGPYKHVTVHVIGMQVSRVNSGWLDVPINEGYYDLLELQNNMTVILADGVGMPVGRLNQLRLKLADDNTLEFLDGGVYNMTVPSAYETGLKVNLNTVVESDRTTVITLDFDANASIISEGSGKYSLKPVLSVKSVTQI